MFRISVCYGHPVDPAAFDAHYTQTHIPLTLQIPGLAGFTTGRPRSLVPNQDAPYHLVASLSFSSAHELKAALKSPEMAAASADVANFATGGVTLFSTDETDHRRPG
ncbi:EthD family reductase [Mycolicibacterium confluentis]|nr:EthD family reductase [Mycolicibacterium confluentis]MCV7320716.1 EthD family reductase [Mycolicibacterium confluentis]ORV30433.1 ethyl tert-butyl ether degradation protein EthD [Mycolicibacterium confluentis]